MKILIDRRFWSSVPKEKKNECQKILENLYEAEYMGTQKNFLNNHNGKRMKGSNGVWKFGLDKGNRILYGYAKEFENIKAEKSDALVILRFACHDKQGDIAKHLNKQSVIAYNYTSNNQSYIKSEEIIDFEDDNFIVNSYINKALFNVINDTDIAQYFENPDDNYDVFLSEEQSRILNNENTPMLLMGCAGSGKTILSVHQMYNFVVDEFNADGIYFALSSPLLEKSQKIYEKICLNETNTDAIQKVQFKNFNDYLKQYLNKNKNKFINYKRFENEFYNNHNRIIKNLDALDVWTEIRGTIKGYMGEKWKWNNLMHQSKITDFSIKYLEENAYICRHKNNKQYLLLMNASNKIFYDENLSENQKKDVHNALDVIKNHYNAFDYEKKGISLDEYHNLNNEYSRYNAEQRQMIYDVFKDYQEWLGQNDYYDDNDLAREATTQFIQYNYQPFSCAIIDESQDFTEMQLFSIFNIISNKEKVLFAGDIHQVINPTYFNEERISRLFYENNLTLNIQGLTKNFRSQTNIVEFANSIAKMRKKVIGSKSKQSEELESSLILGCRPFNLLPRDNNLSSVINRINELPYAAVIVQDEIDKEYLIQLTNNTYSGNIFTIQEIKGLEYRYILCYNMMSKFYNEWKDIFNLNVRKNAKYRFYFNTLYVGITRAQEYLCLYETSMSDLGKNWVSEYTDSFEAYNENALFLLWSENISEEWFKSAQILEEQEFYENAIIQYKKSNVIDAPKHILRCEIKLCIAEGNFEKAAERCLQSRDYQLLKQVAEQSENNNLLILSKALYESIPYAYNKNNSRSKNQFINDLFHQIQKYDNYEELINRSVEISIEQTLKRLDILNRSLNNLDKDVKI